MKKEAFNLQRKLIKKKLKISVAESCTGGLLSSTFTSISGSSKIFDLGLITYSNRAKNTILKVPRRIITKFGAVSYETCQSMVKNLSVISKSNISISITGIAGPNGGTKSKPVGLVYVGLKKRNKVWITKNYFKKKNRILIQKATVKKVLEMIAKVI